MHNYFDICVPPGRSWVAQGIYFVKLCVFDNFHWRALKLIRRVVGTCQDMCSKLHYIIFQTLHRKNSIWNFKLCLPACEYNDFLCSKQLDSQRFSLRFSQVAWGSWDIEGQQIFLRSCLTYSFFTLRLCWYIMVHYLVWDVFLEDWIVIGLAILFWKYSWCVFLWHGLSIVEGIRRGR